MKAHRLKATFFLIGVNVEMYPDIARRIVQDGHQVANHIGAHQDLTEMTPVQIAQDLKDTNDIIKQVTGFRPRFARPPYGTTNAIVAAGMARQGLTQVIWSQDSYDWTRITTPDILNQ